MCNLFVKLKKFPMIKEHSKLLGVTVYDKFFIKLKDDFFMPLFNPNFLFYRANNGRFEEVLNIVNEYYKVYRRFKLWHLVDSVYSLNKNPSYFCEVQKYLLGLNHDKLIAKLVGDKPKKNSFFSKHLDDVFSNYIKALLLVKKQKLGIVKLDKSEYEIPVKTGYIKMCLSVGYTFSCKNLPLKVCLNTIDGYTKMYSYNGEYLGGFKIKGYKRRINITRDIPLEEVINSGLYYELVKKSLNGFFRYPIVYSYYFDFDAGLMYLLVPDERVKSADELSKCINFARVVVDYKRLFVHILDEVLHINYRPLFFIYLDRGLPPWM